MAYILARCPLRVRLVRICILPTGSTFAVALANVVSAAAFLASWNLKQMLLIQHGHLCSKYSAEFFCNRLFF